MYYKIRHKFDLVTNFSIMYNNIIYYTIRTYTIYLCFFHFYKRFINILFKNICIMIFIVKLKIDHETAFPQSTQLFVSYSTIFFVTFFTCTAIRL